MSGEPAPRKPDLGVAELIEAAGARRLTAAEEHESEAAIQARACMVSNRPTSAPHGRPQAAICDF